MLTVLGGLAEFELIRTPTGEGRARAKARGVRMGRKPKLTDHQKREAVKRRDHGEETLAEIGRSYNVSGWTISRLVLLVSVREVVESDESFVIQGWRPDSRRSRRYGRPKTAQNTIVTNCAIRAI